MTHPNLKHCCEELLRAIPSLIHCCLHANCVKNHSICDILVEMVSSDDIMRPESPLSMVDDVEFIDETKGDAEHEPSDEGFVSLNSSASVSSLKRKSVGSTTDEIFPVENTPIEQKTDKKKNSPRKRVKLYCPPEEDDFPD